MTLPSSGGLTIAQILAEIGDSYPVTIPNANWRTLAGKPSGSLVIPTDFYGKTWRSIAQTDSRTTAATSHSSVAFGDITDTTWVGILAFHGNTGTNPGQTPTATIGGAAAARIVAHSTGNGTALASGSALFVAQPGVTSGTVAVSWGGLATTIVAFRTTGYNLGTAFDTDKDTANMSLDTPSLGLLIAATQNASGTGNVTWTNATERGDEAANSKIRSWAWDVDVAAQSALTVSPSPYSATQGASADIVASFSAI